MAENQESKPKTIADLERLYFEADSCDTEVFSEMRSNLLLIAGEHYNKFQSSFFRRIRDSKQINEQQKLRLTKNHIQKITKVYANNIIASAPGVGFAPKNESELKDQKAAELHHAVWQDAKDRYNLDEKIDDWCDDFIGVGEVAVKIFWDPGLGAIQSYQQATDSDGTPLFLDHAGQETPWSYNPDTLDPHQPAPGEPQFEGQMVFEQIHGFNLLRSPEAKSMGDSPYFIVRKMMPLDSLKQKFPEMASKINTSADQTMVVFDPAKGGYHKSTNTVMVKEYFFKPCGEYPQGYFFIATKDAILTEGELPGGIFPIIIGHFEKIQTTPRGRSAVKQMRPYQAEINRAASKMAEHQITLGDDKIIMQNGSKMSQSAVLPGVRGISVSGNPPTVLQGRDGSQYLAYMQSQIEELYQVMMVADTTVDTSGQMDPYAMLFQAASKKKQFQRYIKRFERFLIEITKLYIRLAKIHMPDNQVIYAIGKKEQVNISEFKSADDLCYQIKVEAQSDDLETKMGKQMVLNHLVQYTGSNLSKEDLGKLIRLMPYANFEEGFGDLTIDYDSSTNDILALDRGEIPQVHEYDSHLYCVKRAVSRTRQPDYKFLEAQIQYNYQQYIQAHQQLDVMQKRAIQLAESGYIPTDGYLVACEFYVADPADPAKTRRARVPYTSLKWLIEKLETQGQGLAELETMQQGSVAEMARMLTGPQNPTGAGQER